MHMQDDRKEFEAKSRERALALGQDEKVFDHALSALLDIDRYGYAYMWTWLGLPIIQLPADVMATQEVIWNTKPDVIIETGVARGGSIIFMASLLQLIGKGKVIGVDIDIRAHNRDSIESHPLSERCVLIEGSSVSDETMAKVKKEIPPGASVMVVLDSDHSRTHVLNELRCYGPLVTEGCFLVVADTLLGHLNPDNTPKARSQVLSAGDEPLAAIRDYLIETNRFEVDPVINGKLVMSSSPGGYLVCRKG